MDVLSTRFASLLPSFLGISQAKFYTPNSSNYAIDNIEVSLALPPPIPEPGTLALFALGLLGVGRGLAVQRKPA